MGFLAFRSEVGYHGKMDSTEKPLSKQQVAEARKRRLVAMHLQAMEGNPLDVDDIAMFEMFEREGWSHERRRAYIIEMARKMAAPHAAE